MEILKERAKIVRAKRDELGLTQLELAMKAGVSNSYVQKLEGASMPDEGRPGYLRKVSIALGFEPEYLRLLGQTAPPSLPYPLTNPDLLKAFQDLAEDNDKDIEAILWEMARERAIRYPKEKRAAWSWLTAPKAKDVKPDPIREQVKKTDR
jgi:transcriptional regulator with XRE-family HTH domain